jgi:hypothetical protein
VFPSARRSAALLGTALLAVALPACRGAAPAFGPAPAAARAHAHDFFTGLALRFVNVQRAPKFASGRQKLSRYALSPSRLFGDTSVWTTVPADAGSRFLELEGRPLANGYLFAPRAGAPSPDAPGQARHVMRLSRLGDGEYQWNTIVEQGVGRVRAAEFAEVLGGALRALQQPGPDIRADVHANLPRTAASLGRLFSLDSVRSTRLADGSSIVDLRVRIGADRLRPAMPALASYVDKYVSPSRYKIVATDGRGGRWLDAWADDDVMGFRFRTRDGRLLALEGPARPMPDALQLHVDALAKFSIFEVGVSRMVGDLTAVRTSHERGWELRFARSPKWHLPLGVRHLISGALDRPFDKGGMYVRLTLRDRDAGQTLVSRRADVAVQESAIVRWLGGLGSKAMDDFAGRAEAEENRFTAEAFLALRSDLGASLAALPEPAPASVGSSSAGPD